MKLVIGGLDFSGGGRFWTRSASCAPRQSKARGGGHYPGWYAQWRDQAGRARDERAGKTRTEAQMFLADRLREVELAMARAASGQTAGDGNQLLVTAIAAYDKSNRLRPNHRTKMQQLTAWLAFLRQEKGRDVRLRDVSPDLVEAFLVDLREKKRSVATCNRYLSAIRSLLARAVERREMAYNPLSCLKQEAEDNARDRVPSAEEQERLLAACADSSASELYALVGLAFTTGQRQGRLLTLRWDDVDFRAKTIVFRPTTASRTKGKSRTIPMLEEARSYLLRLPRDGTFVFERGGKRMAFPQIRTAWETARRLAGLEGEIVFHSLRHAFITRLAEVGVDVRVIQQWVGHKSLAVTMRYTHLRDSGMRSVADLLDSQGDRVEEAVGGTYRGGNAAARRQLTEGV